MLLSTLSHLPHGVGGLMPNVSALPVAPTLAEQALVAQRSTTTQHRNKKRKRENVCGNCGAKDSPLWRKSAEGQVLCNKCGLFLARHGRMRPSEDPAKKPSSKKSKTGGEKKKRRKKDEEKKEKEPKQHQTMQLPPPPPPVMAQPPMMVLTGGLRSDLQRHMMGLGVGSSLGNLMCPMSDWSSYGLSNNNVSLFPGATGMQMVFPLSLEEDVFFFVREESEDDLLEHGKLMASFCTSHHREVLCKKEPQGEPTLMTIVTDAPMHPSHPPSSLPDFQGKSQSPPLSLMK